MSPSVSTLKTGSANVFQLFLRFDRNIPVVRSDVASIDAAAHDASVAWVSWSFCNANGPTDLTFIVFLLYSFYCSLLVYRNVPSDGRAALRLRGPRKGPVRGGDPTEMAKALNIEKRQLASVPALT